MNQVGDFYKKTPYQIVYGHYGYEKPMYGLFYLNEWQCTCKTKKEAIEKIKSNFRKG